MKKQQWQFQISSEKKQSWGWIAMVLILAIFFFHKIEPSNSSYRSSKQNSISLDPADVSWMSMQKNIEEITSQHEGKVGVYIKNLKTGKIYERSADTPFVTASLIKIPIMAAAFNAIEEQKFSLDDTFKLRSYHKRGGSGHLKWARSGRRFRTSEIIYRMITESDNTATAILIERLGYDYLNTRFSDFGLVTTQINSTGMRLDDHLSPELDNYTTAREMGMLLEKIYMHELASYGHCDLMMDWMKHAEGRARLRRYLPKTWSLANKGGLLRKNCHDVGIAFTPNADYVICVMTGENRTYKKAIGLIANVAHTAYTHLVRS